MKFRRRRFKTAFLASLVHPLPLIEALKGLQEQGDIEWYEYGRYNCTIKLTKHSGLAMLIEEAIKPVVNPRPYVKNKMSQSGDWQRVNGKIRKTKGSLG